MIHLVILVVALAPGTCTYLEADFRLFISDFGQDYSRAELKARYNLFKTSKAMMTSHNKGDSSFTMVINKFSALTVEEKRQYTGLANETEFLHTLPQAQLPREDQVSPASYDNTAAGYVTRLKDQRSCGSSWAFAAAAAFEGAYARTTGVLKSFSEKELLDCVYPNRDGCKGGWYHIAWEWIQESKRLASYDDAPFDYAKDRGCGNYKYVKNGIKNAEYVGYFTVGKEDKDLQAASYKAVVAVAMVMEDDIHMYGAGIYDGCVTGIVPPKAVSHAVSLTGYTQAYWSVKNSWGREWGEDGYVRLSRAYKNICRIAEYATYPFVQAKSGKPVPDNPDSLEPRIRKPDWGCSWGDDYPCSDMNCNYGCKDEQCWVQCNGFCSIAGTERCDECKEWCWVGDYSCQKHEDCFAVRHSTCTGACTV